MHIDHIWLTKLILLSMCTVHISEYLWVSPLLLVRRLSRNVVLSSYSSYPQVSPDCIPSYNQQEGILFTPSPSLSAIPTLAFPHELSSPPPGLLSLPLRATHSVSPSSSCYSSYPFSICISLLVYQYNKSYTDPCVKVMMRLLHSIQYRCIWNTFNYDWNRVDAGWKTFKVSWSSPRFDGPNRGRTLEVEGSPWIWAVW